MDELFDDFDDMGDLGDMFLSEDEEDVNEEVTPYEDEVLTDLIDNMSIEDDISVDDTFCDEDDE